MVIAWLAVMPAVQADLVDDRLAQMVQANVDSPWPDVGTSWGDAGYALACLHANSSVAAGNSSITNFYSAFPVPDSTSTIDFEAYFKLHLMWRIYHDPDMNARLTTTARDNIEDMMWRWINQRSTVSDANGSEWRLHDSENHDAMQKGGYLLAALGLKNAGAPYGPDATIADGHTIAEHAEAWSDYFLRYFRSRAREGINVEMACPTYAKYSIGVYYNIRDFAESALLREIADRFITLYWADTACDWTLSGVRGGAETRCYKENYLRLGTQYSFHSLLYGYTWHENAGTARLYTLMCATSSYRVPEIIRACATDTNRPNYLYTSRRWGLDGGSVGATYVVGFDSGNSHIRRDTYVTRDYAMGAITLDMNRDYLQVFDQNRIAGVFFASGVNDRIVVFGKGAASNNKSYADLNGVCRENCMVVQRDKNANASGDGTLIFVAQAVWDSGVETNGWFFSQSGNAYCGVKPAGGGYTSSNASHGVELALGDIWAPVVVQMGQASNYADFASFQASVQGNAFAYAGGTLDYTSEAGDAFTVYGNTKTTPRVNGVTVDLNPTKVYDSPYLSMTHGEDVATVSYAAYTNLVLDFSIGPPSVTNDGATGVGVTNATLNGTVISTGGVPTEVYVYWDLADKGTTNDNWGNTNYFGTRGEGSLATDVTGLASNTQYYYRFYATNMYGEDWAAASYFTTALAVTTAGGAQTITQGVARLNGYVTRDTDISIFWDVADRGTNIGGWAKRVMLGGVAGGTFSTDASNLLYGLTYYYRCFASNAVDSGTAWSSAADFSLPVPAGNTPAVLNSAGENLSDTDGDGNPYDFENVPYTNPFNAGASADKLIVSYSSEGGAANATITYNGDPLTRIAGTFGDRHGGIWYLDSPYTGGNADLVIDLTTNPVVNGLGYGVVSISGSDPGVATAAYEAATNTVTITPTVAGSFVVAGFGANGAGTGDPGAPLSELYSGGIGSALGGAGYETNVNASSQTYTFTGPNGGVGAAAFAPDEPDPAALDANDDGIPDAWSVQHFANDPFVAGQDDSDPDGDSLSNYEEYVVGSSPTNGSDLFEVSIVQSNGEVIVSVPSRLTTTNFYGSLTRCYGLQYSTNLLGTNWSGVAGASNMPASGFGLVYTNELGTSRLFYRGSTWLEQP